MQSAPHGRQHSRDDNRDALGVWMQSIRLDQRAVARRTVEEEGIQAGVIASGEPRIYGVEGASIIAAEIG